MRKIILNLAVILDLLAVFLVILEGGKPLFSNIKETINLTLNGW